MLRTFQAQNVKKIRTFSSGSASAAKLDVLIKKKECNTKSWFPQGACGYNKKIKATKNSLK